jgi:hypothetical protein
MRTLFLLLFLALDAGTAMQTARLSFHGPESLTVQCVSGCPTTQVYLPRRFPALRVSDDGREVKLLFRASGYHSDERVMRVHPGFQQVEVQLKPLE